MAAESKLEAARRTGSLTNVIGALREEAAAEPAATSTREQLGIEDASIRVVAGMTGRSDVEKRAALREVRPGSTVSAPGKIAKTQSTRAVKIAKAEAWARGLSTDQRERFILSPEFESLSDRQQELLSEAISNVDDEQYSASIGVAADFDFDTEPVDIDSLPEDETEVAGESFGVQEGEDVESFNVDDEQEFNPMPWEVGQ